MSKKYFSVVRGNGVAVEVELTIHSNPNEYEINDLFDEMQKVFIQAKAGVAAPVSVPSGADNA